MSVAPVPTSASARADRLDIQALRGFAVLLVLAHHAKLPFIHGGYLGVDIFFVISGYLITALIVRDVDVAKFSFTRFYWRRAWRLLPALYAALAFCIALSPFLLRAVEMRDFTKQVFGTITFVGNIALWLQTGYFEQAAELKPLLHVWSLSLEEQYYLLIPAAFVFLPARFRFAVMLTATLLSLGLCMYLVGLKPGATFYLLPTRAWEMGVGSVAALLSVRKLPRIPGEKYIGLSAVVIVAAVAVQPLSKFHPGIDALICCVGTACAVLFRVSTLNEGSFARVTAFVGDRSYSLYLVHWPVFAFLNGANLGPGEVPWPLRLAAALASLLLAWALHRWVEMPFRTVGHKDVRAAKLMSFLATSLGIVCAVWLVQRATISAVDYDQRLRSNRGLDPTCAHEKDYVRLAACETSVAPKIVVWGDSFAMHLMPGLAALPSRGVAQVSRDTCPALIGTALYAAPKFGEVWAKSCIQFNDSALGALANDFKSAEVVVMSSPYLYLLGGQLFTSERGVINGSVETVGDALVKTILAVRGLGKRVVLVGPPPSTAFDMGLCNERTETGKFSIGSNIACDVDYRAYRARYDLVWRMLSNVKAQADVEVISFDNELCDMAKNSCVTRRENVIIYRDNGHFSIEGSQWIAKKMQLVEVIDRLAK